jgi:hypothetical protein
MVKMKIYEIRRLIQKILKETSAGAGVTSDPTDVRGFYDYETERGNDIHGFWYRSPGRGAGSDGDPGRPQNSLDYVGMQSPDEEESSPEENTEDSSGFDENI